MKSQAGKLIRVKHKALADRLAEEWRAAGGKLRYELLPLNRLVMTLLDRVLHEREQRIDALLNYYDGDVLRYFAPDNTALYQLQCSKFKPMLDLAREKFNLECNVTTSLFPPETAKSDHDRLYQRFKVFSDCELLVLCELAEGLHSILLAMLIMDGLLDIETALNTSMVETNLQQQEWGADETHQKEQQKLLETLNHAFILQRYWRTPEDSNPQPSDP